MSALKELIGQAARGSVIQTSVRYSDEEAEFDIPVTVLKGAQGGGTIWIQAALHGDEYDGAPAIKQLSREINPAQLNGTIIFVPILNVTAFKAQQNASPIDNVNLNRVFGTERKGSFSYRFGRFVCDLICENADHMIDLHGGGQYLDVCRFVMASVVGEKADIVEKMAYHCGAELVHLENGADNPKLYAELSRKGIPAVLIENGGGLEALPEAVEKHKRSVMSILRLLGYLGGCPEERSGAPVTESADMYFSDGGLLLYRREIGSEVSEGDVLLRVMRYDSTEYEIRCPMKKGVILSIHTAAIVKDGQYAVMVGKL